MQQVCGGDVFLVSTTHLFDVYVIVWLLLDHHHMISYDFVDDNKSHSCYTLLITQKAIQIGAQWLG